MGLYRWIGRPLLFALPPETAHSLAGAFLRLPLPWRKIAGTDGAPRLETDLAGIRLRNPIGLAAGFDKSCREIRALADLGFGYVVGGSVTRRPRTGNPKPRIVRLRGRDSMVNSMGLPNDGAQRVAERLRKGKEGDSAVFVSLADEDVDDVVANHDLLAPLVDGFELNVSSPNSPWRRERDNEAHLRKVLAELAPRRRRPLFVKLPPYRTPDERTVVTALAGIAAAGGADGLTCSNTFPVGEPRLAQGGGGLSGRSLFTDTPRIVEEMRRESGLPVNACGGIFSTRDASDCFEAGAVTIQIYTALIYEGPRIVRRIADGISPVARSAVAREDE